MHCRAILLLLLIACAARSAGAQISTEEAERKLRAKLATRPATTQPSSEVERLRAENLRLRERVMALEEEVMVLKGSLARASQTVATTRPSKPAPELTGPAKSIIGRWRGGDILAGSGYLLQFDTDNTYKQLFTITGQKQSGQYRVINEENLLEMWNDKWPEDKKHNQYRIDMNPAQLTLTPMVMDGVTVKLPRPLVLQRAE